MNTQQAHRIHIKRRHVELITSVIENVNTQYRQQTNKKKLEWESNVGTMDNTDTAEPR